MSPEIKYRPSQSQSQSYTTTDGQAASLSWCQASIWGHDQIFIALRQLRVCWCGGPPWPEDGSIVYLYNCCWTSPAQSFSRSSPAIFKTTFYCLKFQTLPTWRARLQYLYPQEEGRPVLPLGTGFWPNTRILNKMLWEEPIVYFLLRCMDCIENDGSNDSSTDACALVAAVTSLPSSWPATYIHIQINGLMGGVYETRRWAGLKCPDIRTKFHIGSGIQELIGGHKTHRQEGNRISLL
jgi:hypothetical protein